MSTETREILNFFDSLIFGGQSNSCSLVAQLYIDDFKKKLLNKKHVDADLVMRYGGLLGHVSSFSDDMEKLLRYVDEGNKCFYHDWQPPSRQPTYETEMAKYISSRLAQICRGSLDRGLSSNRYVLSNLNSAYYRDPVNPSLPVFERFFPDCENQEDEETLKDLLTGKTDKVLSFKNPAYWGRITKALVEKCDQNRSLTIPEENVDAVRWLYEQKCRSMNQIVDPFALELVFIEESLVWNSIETLLAFLENEPSHETSRIVRKLCDSVVRAVLRCDDAPLTSLLDRRLLQRLQSFIANVRKIDTVVQSVQSDRVPYKLVDVFHRLLVLTDHDRFWHQDAIEEEEEKKKNNPYFALFMKCVVLRNELRETKKRLLYASRK